MRFHTLSYEYNEMFLTLIADKDTEVVIYVNLRNEFKKPLDSILFNDSKPKPSCNAERKLDKIVNINDLI